MPSPWRELPQAVLNHAKRLVVGEPAANVRPASVTDASRARPADAWAIGPAGWDDSFWTSLAAADKRLVELQRVLQQIEAEATAREEAKALAREARAHASPKSDPRVGESRCEAANRVITDALGARGS